MGPRKLPARSSGSTRRLRRVEETSAGGLVIRGNDRVSGVLIGKFDHRHRLVWSLPKGHVEEGETLAQTAVREVGEETGIAAEIIGPLGAIDYWFVADGQRIHKTVHHFLLRAVGGELSDADVEVTDVAWVPLEDIPTKLSYRDERRLVEVVPRMLTA